MPLTGEQGGARRIVVLSLFSKRKDGVDTEIGQKKDGLLV